MRRLFLAVALLAVAQAGQAQIGGAAIGGAATGLPPVRLPRLPDVGVPGVDNGLARTAGNIDSRATEDLRRLQIRELLRTQANLVEADPRGNPVMRAELLAFSPSDAALGRARAAGYTVTRETALDGLDARIVVLQAPPRTSTRRALRQLRALDPNGTYDLNHLYFESGSRAGSFAVADAQGPAPAPQLVSVTAVRVGLIDGGVDAQHPVFHDATVHQYGCSGAAMPSEHGTAVASLLVGRTAGFRGAAPGAELFAADVYCGRPTGGAADAVADAFAWLVRERVPVINVSLVGPANAMLEAVVTRVIARGHLIVAAVGNDGPAAPPLYPAAYRDVIGVTAVDSHQRVLVEAERGPQVRFAAPGADMAAACSPEKYMAVRGTSFASPIVAGLLAVGMPAPDPSAAQHAVAALIRDAVDLGSRGPDKIYGNGLVGGAVHPDLALVRQPSDSSVAHAGAIPGTH
jgi:subtilisin family serine protease